MTDLSVMPLRGHAEDPRFSKAYDDDRAREALEAEAEDRLRYVSGWSDLHDSIDLGPIMAPLVSAMLDPEVSNEDVRLMKVSAMDAILECAREAMCEQIINEWGKAR